MTQPTYYEGPIMVRGKGTGFLAHPDLTEDIVIERDQLGFALDGDLVKVKLKKKIPGKRQEGVVVEVVKAAYRELIGTVKEKVVDGKKMAVLIPDNLRLHIRPILPEAAPTDFGMKVVVEITKWSQPLLDP
jgi:ribonuclease R